MCVIVRKGTVVREKVVAWKLFRVLAKGELQDLVQGGRRKVGVTYRTGKPGFQAFVRETDALGGLEEWQRLFGSGLTLRKVVLYGAQRGKIDGMGDPCDGKKGWTARGMRILPVDNG